LAVAEEHWPAWPEQNNRTFLRADQLRVKAQGNQVGNRPRMVGTRIDHGLDRGRISRGSRIGEITLDLCQRQIVVFFANTGDPVYAPRSAITPKFPPGKKATCAARKLEDRYLHSALRHERVTAPFVLEGAMNGETFKAYVEQFLAPTLKRGDIVFMDNVSVHMSIALKR